MKATVTVLGSGPAGMFAAWAAAQAMHPVEVYSITDKPSTMFGAQYLHAPIPGLTGNPFRIYYGLEGTLEGYAQKVYGDPSKASETSPARMAGVHNAWNIRTAYAKAFWAMSDRIHLKRVSAENLPALVARKTHRLVVSSVPLPSICLFPEVHQFAQAEIWAVGDAPERGQYCPVKMDVNSVVCNGERSPGWYRAANVLGWKTAEWPFAIKPPIDGVRRVSKPVSTTCACWDFKQEGIASTRGKLGVRLLRVGRYGTWTKRVLSHDAFYWTAHELGMRI